MNYGYDPTAHDEEIAALITAMIAQFPLDERGRHPDVEVNQLYPGVRIRRITHYPPDLIKEMVRRADTIYENVLRKCPISACHATHPYKVD